MHLTGEEWLEQHDLTAEELRTSLEEHKAQGWRPHHLYAYPFKDGPHFLVIMVGKAERPDWTADLSLSAAEYQAELPRRKRDGFRPLAVAAHDDRGQVRYAVIWVRYHPAGILGREVPPKR